VSFNQRCLVCQFCAGAGGTAPKEAGLIQNQGSGVLFAGVVSKQRDKRARAASQNGPKLHRNALSPANEDYEHGNAAIQLAGAIAWNSASNAGLVCSMQVLGAFFQARQRQRHTFAASYPDEIFRTILVFVCSSWDEIAAGRKLAARKIRGRGAFWNSPKTPKRSNSVPQIWAGLGWIAAEIAGRN